jgi:hypothetical protein
VHEKRIFNLKFMKFGAESRRRADEWRGGVSGRELYALAAAGFSVSFTYDNKIAALSTHIQHNDAHTHTHADLYYSNKSGRALFRKYLHDKRAFVWSVCISVRGNSLLLH